jgi:hypothetical protein
VRLLDDIERRIGAEESPFRAQFLREDLVRLRRLRELAAAAADRASLAPQARRLGWTQGDQRTHELHGVLDRLFDAVFDYERGDASPENEERIRSAWNDLTRERLERLVGCLSTPAPRPEE